MKVLQDLVSEYKNAQPQQRTDILAKIIRALCVLSEVEQEVWIDVVSKETGIGKTTLRKMVKEEKNRKKEVNEKDLFPKNVIVFHPSLDFQRGILFFGFRTYFLDNNDLQEVDFYTICTENEIKFARGKFELFGVTFIPEKRKRFLVNAQNCFRNNDFLAFLDGRYLLKPLNEIYQEVLMLLKTFIYFEKEEHYHLVTAWTIGSYFYILFDSYPYLFFSGYKASGKTKVLSLLEKLCFNATKAKITLGSLTDTADALRGTLLLDQCETLNNAPELVVFLADGYKKSCGKRRIVLTYDERKVAEYETYCPKAFASTRALPEDLQDRVIEIQMLRNVTLPDLDDLNEEEVFNLKQNLYFHLLKNWILVYHIYKNTNCDLQGRIRELWRPLLAIYKACDLDEEKIKNIKAEFINLVQQNQVSLPPKIELLYQAILELAQDQNVLETTATDLKEMMEKIDSDVEISTRTIGRILMNQKVAKKTEYRIENKRVWRIDIGKVKTILNAYNSNGQMAEKEKNGKISGDYNLPFEKSPNGTNGYMAEEIDGNTCHLPFMPNKENPNGKEKNSENSSNFNPSAIYAICSEGNEKQKIEEKEKIIRRQQKLFLYDL